MVPDVQHFSSDGSADASVADRNARENGARDELGHRVKTAIAANPGLNSQQLQPIVRATRAHFLATLQQLADDGAIVKVRDGHKVTYTLAAP